MSRIKLKFILDRSITGLANKLIQWDADGDLAYTPNDNGDWLVVPTGALQAIDELADRVTAAGVPTIQVKTANFTAAFNFIYLTTNAISVQLPAPAMNAKITVKIKDTNTVTLLRFAAENIEGVAASYLVTSDRGSVDIVSDGTDWWLI